MSDTFLIKFYKTHLYTLNCVLNICEVWLKIVYCHPWLPHKMKYLKAKKIKY